MDGRTTFSRRGGDSGGLEGIRVHVLVFILIHHATYWAGVLARPLFTTTQAIPLVYRGSAEP
jgi:hypothetical protein